MQTKIACEHKAADKKVMALLLACRFNLMLPDYQSSDLIKLV